MTWAAEPERNRVSTSISKTMQFDLFEDSRDVMLRNDVVAALRLREGRSAAAALERLGAEFPADRSLPALRTLASALPEIPVFTSHETLASHAEFVATAIVPAARQIFSQQADAWLQATWRQLAVAAAGLAFDPRQGCCHAAEYLLRAGDHAGVRSAVAEMVNWRRQPLPLSWMAAALARDTAAATGISEAWPLLVELAWMAPPLFARSVGESELAPWCTLMQKFSGEFESEDDPAEAWFPAWACLADASLAAGVRLAQSGADSRPEQAARCLVRLLSLERQGRHHELVAERKRLRELHAGLFALYMQTRK